MKNSLFPNEENEWQKEWKDMPEFISENKRPIQQITISFRTFEDVVEFGKRLDLKVTPKTDGLWFPMKKREDGFVYKSKEWNNESI